MGYEGHLMLLGDAAERARLTEECMARLLDAHADVGGEVVSGGGTGTHAVNTLGHRGPGRLLRADGHRLQRGRAAVRAGADRARDRRVGDAARGGGARLGRSPTSG
jgi:D-serine deaminase-like pyridoxal phosphate-dependent protein